jgi:hydrogenase expression/formation protein HypC
MCLALPARILERLEGEQARVQLGALRQVVSIALVPEVQPGDYVIVHVGHAIGTLDVAEAEATLAAFAALEALEAGRP